MIFDETAARLPSIPIPNQAVVNGDLFDLFPETAAVDDLASYAHQTAFASDIASCFESNAPCLSRGAFQPALAVPDPRSRASSPVVNGTYPGDAMFKNKIDFKADMAWQERARIKQILTGQASELSHQQQIGFLHAYGISEHHELWAMYIANLSSSLN